MDQPSTPTTSDPVRAVDRSGIIDGLHYDSGVLTEKLDTTSAVPSNQKVSAGSFQHISTGQLHYPQAAMAMQSMQYPPMTPPPMLHPFSHQPMPYQPLPFQPMFYQSNPFQMPAYPFSGQPCPPG
ncbi:hypothetical protein RvY_16383 [Ramazzottius varieornatus]|uniref:Uncharacterized protein n=1 Tax=Ramazzottius varieornatus TaxID=947166 RepID=A0A1D1W4N4_RAMVA|nr:hypothetical protein RvY_16383 [Ramazzottius varieornatus]